MRTRVFDDCHTLLELSSLTVDTGRWVDQLDRQSSSRRRLCEGTELRQTLVAERNGKHVYLPNAWFWSWFSQSGGLRLTSARWNFCVVFCKAGCGLRFKTALGDLLLTCTCLITLLYVLARHPADAARVNARAQQHGFPQGEGHGKAVILLNGAVKEAMRLLPAALNICHALYATSMPDGCGDSYSRRGQGCSSPIFPSVGVSTASAALSLPLSSKSFTELQDTEQWNGHGASLISSAPLAGTASR